MGVGKYLNTPASTRNNKEGLFLGGGGAEGMLLITDSGEMTSLR